LSMKARAYCFSSWQDLKKLHVC